jgi:hypothetical protein
MRWHLALQGLPFTYHPPGLMERLQNRWQARLQLLAPELVSLRAKSKAQVLSSKRSRLLGEASLLTDPGLMRQMVLGRAEMSCSFLPLSSLVQQLR